MDAELRERFDRLDDRQAETLKALNDHIVASAVAVNEAMAAARANSISLHEHLDDHREKRGWLAALWTTTLAAAIISVWNLLTGKKS